MRTLIIGHGEIGKSLKNVLCNEYFVAVHDPLKGIQSVIEEYDIMHICFPYSVKFVESVKEYQKKFKPKFTVIHSTVPVGTSKQLNAIHSPVIGIHPHLETSLKTFTKFLGGKEASEVANYFRRVGMKVYVTDNSESTELLKILCTTYYGLNVEITKEIKRLCDKNSVPFELWTIWNDNYNKGYQNLGYSEYTRQNLVPIMTPQGGHCTIPNTNLLDNKLTKLLRELNG